MNLDPSSDDGKVTHQTLDILGPLIEQVRDLHKNVPEWRPPRTLEERRYISRSIGIFRSELREAIECHNEGHPESLIRLGKVTPIVSHVAAAETWHAESGHLVNLLHVSSALELRDAASSRFIVPTHSPNFFETLKEPALVVYDNIEASQARTFKVHYSQEAFNEVWVQFKRASLEKIGHAPEIMQRHIAQEVARRLPFADKQRLPLRDVDFDDDFRTIQIRFGHHQCQLSIHFFLTSDGEIEVQGTFVTQPTNRQFLSPLETYCNWGKKECITFRPPINIPENETIARTMKELRSWIAASAKRHCPNNVPSSDPFKITVSEPRIFFQDDTLRVSAHVLVQRGNRYFVLNPKRCDDVGEDSRWEGYANPVSQIFLSPKSYTEKIGGFLTIFSPEAFLEAQERFAKFLQGSFGGTLLSSARPPNTILAHRMLQEIAQKVDIKIPIKVRDIQAYKRVAILSTTSGVFTISCSCDEDTQQVSLKVTLGQA
jgi:hypothetical protein